MAGGQTEIYESEYDMIEQAIRMKEVGKLPGRMSPRGSRIKSLNASLENSIRSPSKIEIALE